MLLQRFPDIHWLRKQANSGFADQKGLLDIKLKNKGWPNVALNVTTSGIERKDITAPFTLFMNLEGKSEVRADSKPVRLTEDNFCLVNKGQKYDLLVRESERATTFNLHFGDQLVNDIFNAVSHGNRGLLDNPEGKGTSNMNFYTLSRWKSDQLKHKISHLSQAMHQDIDEDAEYELFADILVDLVIESSRDIQALSRIASLKKSTREEIMNRLGSSVEQMHTQYRDDLSLEELSHTASLSKYHFLRSFKEAFGCSPRQYLIQLRMQKAQELLRSTHRSVEEIGWQLNYQEPASFTRIFKKHTGVSPSQFRISI